MDVAAWLSGLGLGGYEIAFRENDIRSDVLPSLTAEDLKEIGVSSVGDRRRLLDAIAMLRAAPPGPPAMPSSNDPSGTQATALSSVAAPPTAVIEHAATSGAERRQVTVLFCDLVGSTALASRLDPEDLREVMAAYHRTATEVVRHQGGYVARFLGDGVLCYFGWPAAHEDDAEHAIRAGLTLVAAVAGLRSPAGPLAARVGIATGVVVVGDLLGEGTARERGVVGETPNLAARLQALAEPGAVVADTVTRRLTGALFTWADLGKATLKGVPKPVPTWQALGESGIESRFEALRAGHAVPLIGREEELELLLRRWSRAGSGEGQVVLLRGEAGIGKSRLTAALQEVLQSEVQEGFVLYCSPQHLDSPLHPVVVRLERAASLALVDVPGERLAKLEALLEPLDLPPEDVALLAELLSVPTLGRWPALNLSPQRRRERLLQALVRWVRALAARRAVLMVVEDTHWADPTTRELLDLLVAEAFSMALLLVITHRPEFDPSAWIGQSQVTLLQLNRLAPVEHRALLRQVAGKTLPAEVETEILSHTDGVPLFVEEMTRAVLEGGLLREEAGRWVLDTVLPPLAVPVSLHASLAARLDRTSLMREVAQAGAVIGREFAYGLVAEVAGLPEPTLRGALDALAAADLVQRRGKAPEAVYTFRHALIRDAAHGTLLRGRRCDLHRRAANAILRLRPEIAEREPELLAHHRAEAGEPAAAAELYLRAGRRATARSAMREARTHLTRGLALLPEKAADEAARRLEAELQFALGEVAVAAEGLGSAESGRAFGRAVALGRELGRGALLPRALRGLWSYLKHRGDLNGALAASEEALELARRQGDLGVAARALAGCGSAHFYLGHFDLAYPLLEEAASAPGAFEATASGVCGADIAHSHLMRLLAVLGLLSDSHSMASWLIERARQEQHPAALADTLLGSCNQSWIVRDIKALRDRAQSMAELAAEQGLPYFSARACDMLGWVAVTEGRCAEGIVRIELSLKALRQAGNVLHTSQIEAMLSDSHLLAEETDAALAHAEEALQIAAHTGENWLKADLHRRLGGVLLRRGEVPRGEAELCCALDVARSQSARLFELRAARDLARLRRDQGRLAEAHSLLAPVSQFFSEGFAFPDLVEAQALLEELDRVCARVTPVRPEASIPLAM